MDRFLHHWALAVVALAAGAGAARAQPSEDAVKAAFLPKFANYVDWPVGAKPAGARPYQLCVIGVDPFGRSLDHAASTQMIGGQRVVVRRLPSAAGAADCQIAYVRGPRPEGTANLLAALARRPILTVTDSKSGPQRGIIHFTVVGGRVRFTIDNAGAAQRGISISSRLLALAVEVRQANR
jgi:hypothetical protein